MATIPPQPTDDSWRPQLLATLKDCGVEKEPPPRFSTGLLYAFVFVAVVIVSRLVGYAVAQALQGVPDFIRYSALALELCFDLFVLSRIRGKYLMRYLQAKAFSAAEILQKPNSRRPIFYLRSFQFDERIRRPSWWQRILVGLAPQNPEQKMVRGFSKLGPVIAVGRPGEELPSLGAARFYVSHELWQQKVSEVAQASQLVLWATGTTEGLRWEISHLIENLPPEKLILFPHAQLLRMPEDQREAEWTKFLQSLGSHFPLPLPSRLGDIRFFYFSPGWQPHAVVPPRNTVFADLRSWLQPLKMAQRALIAFETGRAKPSELAASGSPAQPVSFEPFSSIIGARPKIYLPRFLGYLLALVLSAFVSLQWEQNAAIPFVTQLRVAFQISLPEALIALAAFHWIRNPWKAAICTAVGAILLIPIFASSSLSSFLDSLSFARIADSLLSTNLINELAFYLFFVYTCAGIKRTWLALIVGAIGGDLPLLARYFVADTRFFHNIFSDPFSLRVLWYGLLRFLTFNLAATLAFAIILIFTVALTRKHASPVAR
jgi:hypothetical protein